MDTTTNDVVAKLIVDGNEYQLKNGCNLIGNASSQEVKHDIAIEDPSLDTKHAIIEASHDGFQLMDLFSRHGTYVEGKKVKRFELIKLPKPLKLQFGSVICHFHPHSPSDSGFLGLNDSTGKDTSIIPSTPNNQNESAVKCVRDRNRSESSASLHHEEPATINNLQSGCAEKIEESFLIKATQAPDDYSLENRNSIKGNRVNTSFLEEDDDFLIPETQEVMHNQIPDSSNQSQHMTVNESFDMFQLCTQDFNEPNDCSNNSDDVIANVAYDDSMIIPPVHPIGIDCNPELKPSILATSPDEKNDSDTDCEEDLFNLRLSETNKSAKENKKDADSRASTPDINFEEQDGIDDFEMTQAFVKPQLNNCKNSRPNQSSPHTSNNDANECGSSLDKTATFIAPSAVTENLEPTQLFLPKINDLHKFSVPSLGQFNKAKMSAKKVNVYPEPNEHHIKATQVFRPPDTHNKVNESSASEPYEATQVFRPPDFHKNLNETTVSSANDLNEFEATQKFLLPTATTTCNTRKSPSPVLLDSDEEDNNDEFCLAETLCLGETSKPNTSPSKNSPKKARRINKLFGSDDEDDVASETPSIASDWTQATPRFEFQLPGKLSAENATFHERFADTENRNPTLLESSDEEDVHDPVNVMNNLLQESEKIKTRENVKPDCRITRRKSSSSSTSLSKEAKTAEKSSKSSNEKVTKSKQTKSSTKSTKEKDQKNLIGNEKKDSKMSSESSSSSTKRTTNKSHDSKLIQEIKDLHHKSSKKIIDKDEKKDMEKFVKDEKSRRGRSRKNSDCENSTRDSKENISSDNKKTSNKKGADHQKNKKRNHRIEEENIAVPTKKSKKNDPPAAVVEPTEINEVLPIRKSSRTMKPRILFTRMDSKPHEAAIEQIGGIIVDDPADCTILITDLVYRTWKLFSAIGRGIPIVKVTWLHAALKEKNSGELPNCDAYLIKDIVTEKRFKFSLRRSLERARKSKVFDGYTFYCTPNTKPPPKEMQSIIECSGGQYMRSISKDYNKYHKCYIVSDKKDSKLWPELRNRVGNVSILSTEAILIAVMQQTVNFDWYLLSL